jgi:hypothetical protein
MATAPLRPNPFEKPENEVTPELELPEEDTESVIIHDDVDSESYLSEEEDQEDNELTPEQLNSGIPQLELLEEEVSDEETVVLDSENQPEFLSGYESEDDYDSDDSGSPMFAPAA